MAITKTLEKHSVTEVMPGMWAVAAKLTIQDTGDGPGFSKILSKNFKLSHSMPALEDIFVEEMQAAIDKYKAEQTYFNHNQFNNLVTAVDGRLVV